MLLLRLTNALGDELNDLEPGYEHTRWPLAQLVEYITEAMEQIAALKPELFAESQVLRLQRGAAQDLPTRFSKLLDIASNVNADGSWGDPIVPASYTLTRNFNKPGCIVSLGKIASFRVDPNNPRMFFVNPPADSYPPQYVYLLGQARPQALASVNDEIRFPGGDADMYFNPIKDWALYRAFMKDTESQSSLARAEQHYRAFYQFLNVKLKSDTVARGMRRQPNQPVATDENL